VPGPQGPQGPQGIQGPPGPVPEAPTDSKAYGRLNAAWTQVLPISGGTLTGSLTIQPAAGAAYLSVGSAVDGQQAAVLFQSAGVQKWQFGKQTDDSLFLYDIAGANYVFNAPSGGTTVTFGKRANFVGSSHWAFGDAGAGSFYSTSTTADRFFAGTDSGTDAWRIFAAGLGANALSINGATGVTSFGATISVSGAVYSVQGTTGTYQFGGSGTKYLVFDGANFVFNGGPLVVNHSNVYAGFAGATASYYFGSGGTARLNYDGTNFALFGGTFYVGPSGSGSTIISGNHVAAPNATTGTYYFGTSGTRYLSFDGTNFNFVGGPLVTGDHYASRGASIGAYFFGNPGSGAYLYFDGSTYNFGGGGYVIAPGGGNFKGHIVGEPSSGNAAAGEIGEYLIATASGVALTTAAAKNITSITLTPGDWDVSCSAIIIGTGSTTFQTSQMGISTVSATLPGTPDAITSMSFAAFTAMYYIPVSVTPTRISVSVNTVVYAVGYATFAAATASANAALRARRVR